MINTQQPGYKSPIYKIRNKHIVEAYFDLLREHKDLDIYQIVSLLKKQPAPRFYVAFENARRFISLLARKKKVTTHQQQQT